MARLFTRIPFLALAVAFEASLSLFRPASAQQPIDRRSGGAEEALATAAGAVDRFVAAFNVRAVSPLVGLDPAGGFRSPDPAADSAVGATFGPRARVFGWSLGENGFDVIDWLPEPWQYHGFDTGATLRPGYRSRISVLGRVVSGTFVTQRERFTWAGPDGARGSRTGSVTYQVRAGRIHRVWHGPAEPDPDEVPVVADPAYAPGEGPTLWMDVWHHNTATPEGTYWNLAELLRRDGWGVRSWEAPFTRAALDSVGILLVANAQPDESAAGDDAGTGPRAGAFAANEIEALRSWIADGGSLVLIADHDPYAGAAADLAAAFGVRFHDGAVRDAAGGGSGNILFRRSSGTLRAHPVTDGFGAGERVDSVLTLLGQGFVADDGSLDPLLVLPPTAMFQPAGARGRTAGIRDPEEPIAAGGWLQAGARGFGGGRVAFLGEAWVFRDLRLAQNARFARNLLRWLARGGKDG